MANYYLPGHEHALSARELQTEDSETQIEVMKAWFRLRFEDPAENMPHDSREGGYIWVWGGPYNAREELEAEFEGSVPASLIIELAEDLENECWDWAPTNPPEYYEELFEDIGEITEYREHFSGSIRDIRKVLDARVDDSVISFVHRLLYVSAITALEAYLSDAFTNTVMSEAKFMRKFVETTPDFKSQKFSLNEIFRTMEDVERKAREFMADLVWHHIHRVRPMYSATLSVRFPDDLADIFRAVLIRHDIVHRNGKTKDGEAVVMERADVVSLVEKVEQLVQHLDTQLAEVRSNPQLNTDEPPDGGAPVS